MKTILFLTILAASVLCGSSAYVSISELMAVRPTVEIIGGRVCLDDI